MATLQAELQLYQKLVRDSAATQGSQGGPGSSGRLLQLLEEVRRLREKLHQGVRNSDALSERLRSKLDTQQRRRQEEEGSASTLHSSSGSQVNGERVEPQRSEGTQTTPSNTQQERTRPQATYSWTRSRPSESQTHTERRHVATGPLYTTPGPQREAKLSLGSLGTLTVKADVLMSDASTTSLPQSSRSARLLRMTDPSLLLSAPQSQSSPFVRGVGVQHTSHAPSLSERGGRVGEEVKTTLFSTRGTGSGTHHRPTHVTGSGTQVDDTRQPLDDYLAREGIPKLEPAMTPLRSRRSSTSSAASLSWGAPPNSSTTVGGTRRQPASAATQTAPGHTHLPPSATPGGGTVEREFESLESRLKQALESSTLQVYSVSVCDCVCV